MDRRGGRRLAALVADGRLHDLLVEARTTPAVGEIWAARVDKPASRAAGGGAFLDLGGARAFLPKADDLAPGDAVKVIIERGPDGAKAAVARRRLEFAGPRMAHTPQAPGVNVSRRIKDAAERARLQAVIADFAVHGGFVLRTAARDVAADALRAEADALVAEAAALAAASDRPPRLLRAALDLATQAARLWPDAPIDEDAAAPPDARPLARFGLEPALAELLGPRVELAAPGLRGAWMALERTAAAVTVDINAGASPSAQAANLVALGDVPRQLRLRGWGGQIVIDLAAGGAASKVGEAAGRAACQAALQKAADPPLEVLGFGPLGLLEARRRRDRTPIDALLRPEDLDMDASDDG